MKYMILLYGSQEDYDAMSGRASDKPAWSAQEFAAMGAFMEAFNKALVDSGELVETRGLTAPVHARRIQLQNGVRSSPTGRTPRLRRSWRATGSWSVTVSIGRRRSPLSCRSVRAPRTPVRLL